MALREIRAFLEGVRSAFRRKSCLAAPGSPQPSRIVGHSVKFLAVAVLVPAAAVVIAVGLAGQKAVRGARTPNAGGQEAPPGVAIVEVDEQIAWDGEADQREWTAIVLHHSATDTGSAASFDAYHRYRKGWHSLGYHFVVGNGSGTPDGAIEVGPRWRRQEAGAHANSGEFNRHGIGICLVGNFEHASPTPAQVASAKKLVAALAERFHIAPERILGHCDIREGGGTACPGKHFPMDEIRRSIDDRQ